MQKPEPVPVELLLQIQYMQVALTDLLRAVIYKDDTYIVRNLSDLEGTRREIADACQTWRPELRIRP